MEGFINPGPEKKKILFPERVFWEEITPLKSPPRDTHFPQGTSSFFNDPWGGGVRGGAY